MPPSGLINREGGSSNKYSRFPGTELILYYFSLLIKVGSLSVTMKRLCFYMFYCRD